MVNLRLIVLSQSRLLRRTGPPFLCSFQGRYIMLLLCLSIFFLFFIVFGVLWSFCHDFHPWQCGNTCYPGYLLSWLLLLLGVITSHEYSLCLRLGQCNVASSVFRCTLLSTGQNAQINQPCSSRFYGPIKTELNWWVQAVRTSINFPGELMPFPSMPYCPYRKIYSAEIIG